MEADAWHHRSDAITSAAAFIGISIALLGGKGYENADNWAALAAACVIAFNGWRLLRPAFNELMDRSPDREIIEQIDAVAATIPGVDGVEKCFVRKMGYRLYVDMHVEVDPQMTVVRSHEHRPRGEEQGSRRNPRRPRRAGPHRAAGPAAKPAMKADTHFKGWAKPGPVPPGLGAPVSDPARSKLFDRAGSEPGAPLAVEPHETLDAISGHFRLFQLRDGHRFSTDDILTAWYGTSWCPTARRALDLGSGIGTVGMICAWRLPGAKFVTVEAPGGKRGARPKIGPLQRT